MKALADPTAGVDAVAELIVRATRDLAGSENSSLIRRDGDTWGGLERQTASAAVLRSIAETRGDVRPVLQTIVDEALRLCRADASLFWERDGDEIVLEAIAGAVPEAEASRVGRRFPIGTAGIIRPSF